MMEIIHDINSIEAVPTVATIGSFDGIHRGHVAMIEETKRRAAQLGLPVTLVTFAGHPRLLFDTTQSPFLLSSPEVRMERLAATGVERCVVLDFNRELAAMTAQRDEALARADRAEKTLADMTGERDECRRQAQEWPAGDSAAGCPGRYRWWNPDP